MSNLKGPPTINCIPLRRYTGHKDGVWEVSVSRMGLPIIGTASAGNRVTNTHQDIMSNAIKSLEGQGVNNKCSQVAIFGLIMY
jgi:hypothetical protein